MSIAGRDDLGLRETERLKHVEVPGRVLLLGEPEAVHGVFADDEHVEGVLRVRRPREGRLDLCRSRRREALGSEVSRLMAGAPSSDIVPTTYSTMSSSWSSV